LGQHTGLSAALLSQLERGKLFPTLPTLLRIATVFGVGLDSFFSDQRKPRAVGLARRAERVRLPDRPATEDVQYYFECLDYPSHGAQVECVTSRFREVPVEKLKPHQHLGVEFLYVRKGPVTLRIGGEEFVLGPEDAIYFDSSVAQSYGRRGSKPFDRRDCHRSIESGQPSFFTTLDPGWTRYYPSAGSPPRRVGGT